MPCLTQEPLYSINQVAKHLQVSRMTVIRLIKREQLVAYKVGGQIRIPRSGVEGLLRNGLCSASHMTSLSQQDLF